MTDNARFLPIASEAPTPGRAIVEWPVVAERMRQAAAERVRAAPEERCELCGAEIASEHGHVVNVPSRTLLCVCRPCYLLFTQDGAGGARFRAVPQRYRVLPGFAAALDDWELLQIPIGLAFFFRNSATGRTTAFYPSPAGATESELPLDAWEALVRSAPALSTLASDVEALLVRSPLPKSGYGVPRPASPQGADDAESAPRIDALIVPIDACYELVGRIRRSWRGFQGGDDVWREIDEFFARAISLDTNDRQPESGDRGAVTA
jgi:hypothetical protein